MREQLDEDIIGCRYFSLDLIVITWIVVACNFLPEINIGIIYIQIILQERKVLQNWIYI